MWILDVAEYLVGPYLWYGVQVALLALIGSCLVWPMQLVKNGVEVTARVCGGVREALGDGRWDLLLRFTLCSLVLVLYAGVIGWLGLVHHFSAWFEWIRPIVVAERIFNVWVVVTHLSSASFRWNSRRLLESAVAFVKDAFHPPHHTDDWVVAADVSTTITLHRDAAPRINLRRIALLLGLTLTLPLLCRWSFSILSSDCPPCA